MKSTRPVRFAPSVSRFPSIASSSVFVALLFAGVAEAHPGHHGEIGGGFDAGWGHPWLGIDHVAAMVMVGLLAVAAGSHRLWTLPLVFLSCVATGGAFIFLSGLSLATEPLAAVSLLALGAALIRFPAIRFRGTLPLVAVAGIAHGGSHAAGVGNAAGGVFFLVGLVLATTVLHALGMSLGVAIRRSQRSAWWLKGIGVFASATGMALLWMRL